MDYLLQGLLGEKPLTRVVGIFACGADARTTARRLLRLPGMEPCQVRLLSPEHAGLRIHALMDKALDPEDHSRPRRFLQAHAVAGLAGALWGLALFIYWIANGQPAVLDKPLLAALAIVGFGATCGLMLGALATGRPAHLWGGRKVRRALRARRFVVVAHPFGAHQTALAQDLMDSSEALAVRTLR